MAQSGNQVWTVPNALSVLRLAGVPLFLWLLLGPQEDGWAIVVFIVSGITDWLDGKLARWLNQMSKFGAMLDPLADRLYTLAAMIAFVVRDIVPLWVVILLVARDLAVLVCLPLLRRAGYGPPEVLYLGKGATFVLLYAFPFLLFAQIDTWLAGVAQPIAYAFTVWGVVLYVWSGLIYILQAVTAIRRPRSL
ncbi:CDP-alcohol phosphatidyltransferase family protein [Kibdelosporangium phytohabitans]|uniref:CDP-diacylglycerol--glycerol-3-phosphate 3-phosphatidyltransferase n=1 Tax=Kibdelosporangium phytohabitans TaxID=860235 RepID=A0A0N9I0E2_9PSEU|nr:CDP-alcohol phosphatidyltransferase family protein [Kibdelosporangium phytohabitans]ALG11050.1 CDP-diacylglycerol--glycerol-3-phosphate 3-phosphatidyltransferase [Kibdelosporangium phytohabitans]MBE1462280.1 cardiolipin synthase [Kibdelosporangium phytohabitans]